MKTLRLTPAESAAYPGVRRFWRAMRKQPDPTGSNGGKLRGVVWNDAFDQWDAQYFGDNPRLIGKCPYGKPGDRIRLRRERDEPDWHCITPSITAITVEKHGGKWGWVVEVKA